MYNAPIMSLVEYKSAVDMLFLDGLPRIAQQHGALFGCDCEPRMWMQKETLHVMNSLFCSQQVEIKYALIASWATINTSGQLE